jgi:putative Mg2+ transporter-C (MgtC) family protein
MEALQNISMASLLDSLISLTAAFLLGGLIGLERQYRQRTAGLRTNVLVAVGAAIFVDAANRLHGHEAATHVLAYVVSGIGFLGAGVIMRGEGSIQGLNTAATLWCSAAVGACAGADLLLEAIVGAVYVLAANTLLRPVVNRINRQPLNVEAVEVTHTVCVIASREHQQEALALLENTLESASYPIRDVKVNPFGEADVEIKAMLTATSVSGKDLDELTSKLTSSHLIDQAFWNPSTLQ